MSSSPSQPLAGRRLWIAGIGGAGMSAYAFVAHAWGAEVAGWDRVETPYLAHLDGHRRDDRARAAAAAGRLGGLRLDRVRRSRRRPAARRPARRARLAAALDRRRGRARQDDDERDDRVLPRPARPRSRVPDRRRDPAARRQRARRRRAGSSSRATSPTARSPRCARRSRSCSTSTSTTMRRSGRAPRWRRSSRSGSRTCRRSCAPRSSSPSQLELAVPGEHNRRNAAAALAALELAGVARADAERVIVEFARRRSPARAARRGARGRGARQLRPPSGGARGRSRRDQAGRPRARALPAAPLLADRASRATSSRARSQQRTRSASPRSIRRARSRSPGVTGRLIVDELARVRPGMRIGWAPALDDAAAIVSSLGAAGRHRAHARRRRRRPRRRRCCSRRSRDDRGGSRARRASRRSAPAARRARSHGPRRRPSVEEPLRWAAERGARGRDDRPRLEPARRRRGRRRARPQARGRARGVAVDGDASVAGGGAANAVALHRARAAGLGGFEFACAIPGTIGGGVWMNGGAYGGDFSQVLERARVVDAPTARLADAGGARPLLPPLRSPPRPGRRRGRAAARAARPGGDQGDGRAS